MKYFPFIDSSEMDFSIFNRLGENQIKDIVEILNETEDIHDFFKHELIIERIKKRIKVDVEKINDFLLVLALALRVSDNLDDIKETLKQMVKEAIDDKELRNKVIEVYGSITIFEKYFFQERLENYKFRGNNSFKGVSYTCELRGRFHEDYDSKSTPIEEYQPVFIDTIPMVSIKINTDNDDLVFQVTEKELNGVISNLLAAQKEISLLINKHKEK